METGWERSSRRRRQDRHCPNVLERERKKEVGDIWHLEFSASVLPALAHQQSFFPTPLAWLSFLSHGPPYRSEVDGGASRSRIRWPLPTMQEPGPLQVAEVEYSQDIEVGDIERLEPQA